MINLLAGPIAGMIKDAVTGFVETKKAKSELNWNPRKTSFSKLIEIMMKSDIEKVKKEKSKKMEKTSGKD